MILRSFLRLVSFVLLAYVLGFAAFSLSLPRPADAERTEGLVVLTGGTGRLDRGFELMERGLADRMLISGVQRTVRPVDLEEAYEVDPDLLECCVDLGREAFDTRSNADEVERWVERREIGSFRLVTNAIHMPRARYELGKRLGPEVEILPDPVVSDPSLRALFLEYNKYLLGRLADLIGI